MSLKELLGEELYNQVIEKAGDNKIAIVSDGNWFPKEKFDAVNNENKNLKQQIADRDEQLETLKEVDPAKLQQEITDLQQANKDKDKEHQEETAKQQKEFAIELALRDAGALNTKAVKALLDTESVKLDGETLLGLDTQLETLKESDGYLFKSDDAQNEQQPGFQIGGDGKGNAIPNNPFSKKHWNLTEQGKIFRENPDLYKTLQAQAEN